MECNYRGISRTAIIKRRQNRIRQCRTLYPNDGFLDNISVNLHVHNQVDNIPLPGHGTLHEPEQMEIQEHSEIGREQDIEKNYQQNIENREDFTRGRDDLNDTFERNDDENKDEHDRLVEKRGKKGKMAATKILLEDLEKNIVVEVWVSAADAERAKTDMFFATKLLQSFMEQEQEQEASTYHVEHGEDPLFTPIDEETTEIQEFEGNAE
ncbi:hypothetical protein PV326_012686, partial [Microctonus aethiopoides]